ncbi:glycoside hydrolase family 88 protein [Bipolaris oryzae ATCC 44560]|uniref:Glycoside hydrolase family 88 protein n=1 Tax=Bipolaris oryzae ATCC 44560 TaxID=930090 RepID=W6ZAC8_COCMI|nr:glycoside hydrolase family 88 protein [Bipolaris oryzae ATCC 44560]EUC44484.1 glycoside hydrolase family 88 protein [Bipolaris oryzae ATCC 44560]
MGDAVQEINGIAPAAVIKNIDLSAIFSENVLAKIIQVAQRGLKKPAPLPSYPHTVPQTGPNAGRYEERESLFWTCGFFPGSIYTLLERSMKYPQALSVPPQLRPTMQEYLLKLGRHYSVAIRQMSSRTDTHDMGFIVQPALQRDWELTGNKESLAAVVNAAEALASRYDERVQAIRSWDTAINDRYSITDMEENFLVIIDSMCNLDLLYFTSHTTSSPHLSAIATTHATRITHEILRQDYSSYHLVNFSPRTGLVQAKMTNQGHADASTWSRGQAWSVLGFAQTYAWTKDAQFLATAVGCARYFLKRCREGEGRWRAELVPRWDFDAPVGEGDGEEEEGEGERGPLRDVSAGVIAANGLLIIHQALQGLDAETAAEMGGGVDFLETALQIVAQTIEYAYDSDMALFEARGEGKVNGGASGGEGVVVKESSFDGILRHSTTNWNEHAHQKYKDHGLVYADYYLLEFGNKLLRAGLI